MLVLALACAATAVARPKARLTVPEDNGTVIFLVDVSGSMHADDIHPTRLVAAVNAMQTFVARLPPNVKVGLVTFSSEPGCCRHRRAIARSSARRSTTSSPRRDGTRRGAPPPRWDSRSALSPRMVCLTSQGGRTARRDRARVRRRPEPRHPSASAGRTPGACCGHPRLRRRTRHAERRRLLRLRSLRQLNPGAARSGNRSPRIERHRRRGGSRRAPTTPS